MSRHYLKVKYNLFVLNERMTSVLSLEKKLSKEDNMFRRNIFSREHGVLRRL
jgi:hypothetical protein